MERNVVYIAVFAALIAVLGLLPKLTLISGIPITAQSLGIMLCGTILGAKRGALAVLLFLALVALGLPLLAGGRGGLGVFTTPWAGFLFGFPVAAFVAGLMMELCWRVSSQVAYTARGQMQYYRALNNSADPNPPAAAIAANPVPLVFCNS